MTDDKEMIDLVRVSLRTERKLRHEAELRVSQLRAHVKYLDAVIIQMREELEARRD